MKLKTAGWLTGLLLVTGCASLSLPRAVVENGTIRNPSLGLGGFAFQIPDGFKLYNPAEAAEYTPLQQMAIRIYELNGEWHPRDNELFYESFLLLSDQTCFMLVTLRMDATVPLDASLRFREDVSGQQDVLPFYNLTVRRVFELGESRMPAVYAAGSACERSGWYYPGLKRNGTLFNYEACRIAGSSRDQYILMGFALPEQAAALSEPMQQMLDGISFSAP